MTPLETALSSLLFLSAGLGERATPDPPAPTPAPIAPGAPSALAPFGAGPPSGVTLSFTKHDHAVTTVVASHGATRAAGRATYVCPMHPEVVADKPGLCPKCNMKLEPKAAAEVRRAARHAHDVNARPEGGK